VSNTYTTQIRVLLCEHCGAPIQVAPEGGYVACTFCNAQNQITQRREFAVPPPSAPIDENERLRRLRMQDGKPIAAPPALGHLIAGGVIAQQKVQEAFHIYQQTRGELDKTSSPDAAERLYFLTMALNTHLATEGDHGRRRALLETSLETLTLPRHVQVVRCLLSGASAKEGDLGSAEEWIRPCNPTSDDIEADSAYRVARALLDTHHERFDAVLGLLGTQDDVYPIADNWDPTVALLRANALERLGDVNGAATALRARMDGESSAGRIAMAQIRDINLVELGLCPQSYPIARQSYDEAAAAKAARASGGTIGTIFFYVGLGICVFGVLLALGLSLPFILGGFATGQGAGEAVGVGVGLFSGFLGLVTTVPLGAIFAVVGYVFRKKAQKASWLRLNGFSARAKVRSCTPTNMRVNDVPVMRIEVEVMHPQHAPYVTSFQQTLSGDLSRLLATGNLIPIRVHPTDPQQVVIES
jgi:hypothetical protein